jgi:chemotaxis methyl-accepting protein methylase
MDRIVLPWLFQKGRKSSLIWSVGCAEGEEAYSVAILLLDRYGQKLKHQPVKIVATDVNEEAIKIAQEGRYTKKRLVWVDDSLIRRYFRFKDGVYEVKNIVRGIVEFKSSDVLKESDIHGADVVMLRNLLIYFDKARQDEILKRTDSALKSGGFLILGKSETIPVWMRDSYQAVAFRERIYRKV